MEQLVRKTNMQKLAPSKSCREHMKSIKAFALFKLHQTSRCKMWLARETPLQNTSSSIPQLGPIQCIMECNKLFAECFVAFFPFNYNIYLSTPHYHWVPGKFTNIFRMSVVTSECRQRRFCPTYPSLIFINYCTKPFLSSPGATHASFCAVQLKQDTFRGTYFFNLIIKAEFQDSFLWCIYSNTRIL